MQTPKLFLIIVLLLALAGGLAAMADDSDIFLQSAVSPNVVILLDSSGSMSSTVNGERKIDSAQRVITDLLENVEGVNIGVFKFLNGNTGELIVPIGVDTQTAIDSVNSVDAGGSTPLGRATQQIQNYYMSGYRSSSYIGGTDSADDAADEDDDDSGNVIWVTNPSPIEYECQKNYAILITDGMPKGEAESLVTTVAASLFTTDHSPLTGMQNVVVHTVGFDVPEGRALMEATATAGGGNFYMASNAGQLERALRDALAQVIVDHYAFSVPLIPSTGVDGGGYAYVASFQPDPVGPFWKGFLKAYRKDSNGLVPTDSDGLPLDSAKVWEAGQELADRSPGSRKIYTDIGGDLKDFKVSESNVTKAMLNVATNAERDKLIAFIRGVDAWDYDRDGRTDDERPWKLGDIYHSNPVLVFPPPLTSTDPDYLEFKEDNKNRKTIVLVGANDGMLHAFDTKDGKEEWAFISSVQLDDLIQLTGALGGHPYYADSTPVVADIKDDDDWMTVAVFGGRRGTGWYNALDITETDDPEFLWKFTDSEIEETWSEPAIGKVKMDDGTERFVAFFGGGFDSKANNAHGRAFYAVDAVDGSLLWKYDNSGSGDARYMNFSLAASPTAVDVDNDGFVDRVIIGDAGGQLWKFDVSAPAKISGGKVTNWTGKRLFVADPSQSNPPAAGEYLPAQGMFSAATLSFDAYGNLWVFIGTGDRNNPNATSSNLFYGIKDDTDMTNASAMTKSDLVDASTTDAVTQGWYLPMAASEKVLASATVFAQVVHFATYTPTAAAPCESGDGVSKLYSLAMADGNAGIEWGSGKRIQTTDNVKPRSKTIGSGIPGSPQIVMGTTTDTVVVGTTDEEITSTDLEPSRVKEIRYWREVY